MKNQIPNQKYILFAKRLRSALNDKGLTQQNLSNITGVSRSMISLYLSAKNMPESDRIYIIAHALEVDPAWLFGADINPDGSSVNYNKIFAIRIPVLSLVPAGIPIDTIEEILGWEELDTNEYSPDNEYFALMVRGDSMTPDYLDGDIIIVQESCYAESGKDVVAFINNQDGKIFRLYKYENGSIELRTLNPLYESMKFTKDDVENITVVICGIVKELRRKI